MNPMVLARRKAKAFFVSLIEAINELVRNSFLWIEGQLNAA